jgi:hypothetical protein
MLYAKHDSHKFISGTRRYIAQYYLMAVPEDVVLHLGLSRNT